MPPPMIQAHLDGAWPAIERVVTKVLGDHDDQPITKVCPETQLSDVVWKAEGRTGWQPWLELSTAPSQAGMTRWMRSLATGGREYTELRYQLALTVDELVALSVAPDTDANFRRVSRWAEGARGYFTQSTAGFVASLAGVRLDGSGSSIGDVLAAFDGDPRRFGRFRLALVDLSPIDSPPRFVAGQVRLSFPDGPPEWRGLLTSADRAGVLVERAFALTLRWQPTDSGVSLVLDERFAYRVPDGFDRNDVIVIV